jgi:hypothetical protein
MTDELGGHKPPQTTGTTGRRFRPHELTLADGGRLVLAADGAIDQFDEHGTRTKGWEQDDPEWPDQAIRFGLVPQPDTITPQGRDIQGTKPPRR